MRAADATHATPILLVGEAGDHDRTLRGFEIGASDWLLRPLDVNELRVRARNQIRRKFYQERLRADLGQALNLAITDPLTGLERGPRAPVSLLMIDVDHFKEINDALGHAGGKEALLAIAETLRRQVRAFDTLARYGGEEFVVVMPGIGPVEAVAVAARLRAAVEVIPLAGTPRVTVSIGVASAGQAHCSGDSLLRAADAALYEAKRAGRNRVKLAGRMLAPAEAADPAT